MVLIHFDESFFRLSITSHKAWFFERWNKTWAWSATELIRIAGESIPFRSHIGMQFRPDVISKNGFAVLGVEDQMNQDLG